MPKVRTLIIRIKLVSEEIFYKIIYIYFFTYTSLQHTHNIYRKICYRLCNILFYNNTVSYNAKMSSRIKIFSVIMQDFQNIIKIL